VIALEVSTNLVTTVIIVIVTTTLCIIGLGFGVNPVFFWMHFLIFWIGFL